jgi:hypothetical protein
MSLLPGEKYQCAGTIEYANYENVTIKSTKVHIETKKFDFNLAPKDFQIDIKFDNSKNWNLKFYYKSLSASYRQVSINKTLASELTIDNLEMATSYTICLALEHNLKCPNPDSECHKCENTQTNEAKPFSPGNVMMKETENKMLQVTWEKSQKPSGTILSYNIVIEGHCIASDTKACSSAFCQVGTSELKKFGPAINRHLFDVQPYWSYQVFISATNSKGVGKNATAKINTKPEPHYPSFKMEPGSKNLTVILKPSCPYTGPASFNVSVYGTDSLYYKNKIVEYDLEKEKILEMETPIAFDNMTPAKEYQVCISVLDSSPSRCNITITKQIPPEGHPSLKEQYQDENRIKLNVQRPENAYHFHKEVLNYYFKMVSQCQYSDERCSKSMCIEDEVLTKKSSVDLNFELIAVDLQPYWMHKFQTMLENRAGNGSWSNWTIWYNTTKITDKNLQLIANFSSTSSDKSIGIYHPPLCPYKGKFCHFKYLYLNKILLIFNIIIII